MNQENQKRQPCERFSRIVGYLRPVQQWNDGKQAEWEDRKMFNLLKSTDKAVSVVCVAA